VRAHRVTKFTPIWSSHGLPSVRKMSLWAREPEKIWWEPNKERIPIGHYASASYDSPRRRADTEEAAFTPQVTQEVKWLDWMDRSEWLDVMLERQAPHPKQFTLAYQMVQGKHTLYAWRPEPPSEDVVALGMLFTSSPEPPAKESLRCIHKSWLQPATSPPRLVWNNESMPGRPVSFWIVNSMQLVWASKGSLADPPQGPFYELRADAPFQLADLCDEPPAAPSVGAPPSSPTLSGTSASEAGEESDGEAAMETEDEVEEEEVQQEEQDDDGASSPPRTPPSAPRVVRDLDTGTFVDMDAAAEVAEAAAATPARDLDTNTYVDLEAAADAAAAAAAMAPTAAGVGTRDSSSSRGSSAGVGDGDEGDGDALPSKAEGGGRLESADRERASSGESEEIAM